MKDKKIQKISIKSQRMIKGSISDRAKYR